MEPTCDCGHPVTYHREDSFTHVFGCHWCPPHSKQRCACKQVTQTGVYRNELYHKGDK